MMLGKSPKGEITISEGNPSSAEYLKQRLVAYNMQQVPQNGTLLLKPATIVITENDGQIIGGINATMIRYWQRCHIDIFWIEETYRGRGYGRKLLEQMEQIAISNGCKLIQLETYDFQAPDFYQQNGYELFGIIENDSPKYTQYFLKKVLNGDGIL